MKVSGIQSTFGAQTNINKNKPNFGVKLKASIGIQQLVQKEFMNLGLRSYGNPKALLATVFAGFMSNINKFGSMIRDIEPEELEIRMDLSQNAVEYTNDLIIDGKLYSDKYNDKPVLLGFKDPRSQSGEYIASEHELPVSWGDFYNLKFDVKKLANYYKDITGEK